MRVNFGVQKFKKIEDEEMKERKKKEQALNSKKQLLLEQFSEKDELTKNTTKQLDNSAKTDSSVGFKHELDRLIDQTKRQDEKLQQLENKLAQISSGDYHGSSMFSSIISNKNNQKSKQFMGQQTTTTGQFSRIFSKSYYRSGNLESLGASQMQNKEEIEQYFERLKQEIQIADSNIANEEERTMSIQNQLEQLFKTKQKMKRQVLEIESMTEAADKRFDGMARIEFVAKQKRAIAGKQLTLAKNELTEQDEMRQNIISRQSSQFEIERASLQSSEEQTGHMMLRIDELESYLQNQKKIVDELLMQERKILKKRMQSKYILKYIHFFHTFKQLFQGRKVDEDAVKNLYDEAQEEEQQQLIEGHPHHASRHFDDIVKESNNEQNEGKSNSSFKSASPNEIHQHRDIQQSQRGRGGDGVNSNTQSGFDAPREQILGHTNNNTNLDNVIPISPNEIKRSTEEIPVDQESAMTQRTELIEKINEFLNENGGGDLSNCVSSVLKVLNEQRYQQEANNEQYEMLLQAKTQSTQDLMIITEKLAELKRNNPHVEEMKLSVLEELKHESIQEAIDTGYLRLPDAKNHEEDSAGKNGEKSIKNHFTTVNIQRQSDGQHQFQLIEKEINANKNFFFNFFMSYGDSLVRLCRVIKTIFKTILQSKPSPQMHKRYQDTIKYVQSVWAESERKQDILDHSSMPGIPQQIESAMNSPLPQLEGNSNHPRALMMIDGLTHLGANPANNNNNLISLESEVNIYNPQERKKTIKGGNIGGRRKIVQEKFTKEETREMFNNAFGSGFNKQADEFYQLLRNDRVVWFFCDNDAVQNYLFERYSSSNQDSSIAAQSALDDYGELEMIGKQESNYKLNEFQNNLTGLIAQMRIERQEIEEDLRSKGVNITDNKDQLKYYKQSDNNPNVKITTAIQNVIKRQQEYQYEASEAAAAKEDQQLQVKVAQPLSNTHHQMLHVKHIDEKGKQLLNIGKTNELQIGDEKLEQNIQTDVEFLEIVDYITQIPSSRQREAHKRHYVSPPQVVQGGHAHSAIHQQTSLSSNQVGQIITLNGQQSNLAQNTSNPAMSNGSNQQFLQAQNNSNNPQNNQNISPQSQQQQQQQISAAVVALPSIISQPQQVATNQQQQQQQQQQKLLPTQQSQAAGMSSSVDPFKSSNNVGGGILKKKVAPMKTLEYKSVFDVNEDNFIDEESKKQKDLEKQQYLEYLALEKEKEKKSLQIQRELEPNAQFKVIQNLNKRLTSSNSQANIYQKNLRHFSLSSRVLSKIEFLDRNHNNNQEKEELIAGDKLLSQLQMEKHNIFRDLVKQEQNEKGTAGLAEIIADRIDTEQETEGDNTATDSNNHKKDPLFPPRTLTQTYLKSTAAMEERKKAALRTIRELELQRVKSMTVLQVYPTERQAKTSENHSKNSRKSQRQIDKQTSNTKPTPRISQQNPHQQFISAQNMKFFTKYNEQMQLNEQQQQSQHPEKQQQRIIPQGMASSQKSQSEHSFKVSNQLAKIASPRQLNGLQYRAPNKSEQLTRRILQSSQTKSTYNNNNINNNLNDIYQPISYDNMNFMDFPFFSTADLSSLGSSNSGNLYTPNPLGQLYVPTGLLSNFKSSQSVALTPDSRINYF